MIYKIQIHKFRNCDIEPATAKQIKYLKTLCFSRDIKLPDYNLKKYLTKMNAMKAIRHLVQGDQIEFVEVTSC